MLKLLCAVRMRLLLDAIMGGGRRRRSRGLAVVYALLLVYLVWRWAVCSAWDSRCWYRWGIWA